MKCLLFFLLFLPSAYAAGIAVSPDRIDFSQSDVQEFLIMNPNDFAINYDVLAPEGIVIDVPSGKIFGKESRKTSAKLINSTGGLIIVKASYENNGFGMFPAIGMKIVGANRTVMLNESKQLTRNIENFEYPLIIALSLVLTALIIKRRKSYVQKDY